MRTISVLTLLLFSSCAILSSGDETASVLPENVGADEEVKHDGSPEPQANSETLADDVENLVVPDAKEAEETAPGASESGGESVGSADVDEAPKTDEAHNRKDAQAAEKSAGDETKEPPVQSGPFIDLLGESLLSLEMIDEKQAQLHAHYTNEALSGKKVVGLYFSADWCGPCRQFTPDLVNFYNKINSRRGKENEFEIVWISRCRDFDSFGQYFTHMNWLAMPPQEAMGQRGQMLSEKYKVKSIPTLVLLDEVGNTITTDGRNKIPMDKAGIGFPWRNPITTIYMTIVPKSLRLLLKTHISQVKEKVSKSIKGAIGIKAANA